MVKAFRVFFHVFFGILMGFLGILILTLTIEMMFFDGKFSSMLVFLFWCSLASCIGGLISINFLKSFNLSCNVLAFWLLTLWIIHGVIEAIQFELMPVMNRCDKDANKEFISSSV